MEFLTTLTGKQIQIEEFSFPGMAGEPTTILIAKDSNGKDLNINEVIQELNPEDQAAINEWYDQLTENNHHSAVSWCI